MAETNLFANKKILVFVHNKFCFFSLFSESSLHLLPENFPHLASLDISENEIFSLDVVSTDIENLKNLKSLQVEENPCYVSIPDRSCMEKFK